jgi:hypothetical protein
VPIAQHFEGHEICGDFDDWINGIVLFPPKSSVHPTRRGVREYADIINDYLESIRTGWPAGYFPTGLPKNPAPGAAPLTGPAAPATPLPEFGDLEVTLASAPAGCESAESLIVPGESAALAGSGFAASEGVTLTLYVDDTAYPLGAATADSAGDLATTVSIPSGLPVGNAGTVEALGAGPDGVGRLLFDLVQIESSTSVDGDGDGVPDGCDNCPGDSNSDQSDVDGDGQGDVCDLCPTELINDEDGDGLCASADICPLDPDNDVDADGVCMPDDNCAITANATQDDTNGDGIGDACEALACYNIDLTVQLAGKGEIIADAPNCGLEGYFDGTSVTLEAAPTAGNFFTGWTGGITSLANPLETTVSSALSLTANFCDDPLDADCDTIQDAADNCTLVPNTEQTDSDGDNFGNACDADLNNDGVVNGLDVGPFVSQFGTVGPGADFNSDGVVNGLDVGPFVDMFGQAPGPSGLVP